MDVTPTHAGPYKLLRLLGQGGSASVYVAEHEEGGPLVALKLLSAKFARDPHRVARFLQEAQILEPLQHPGVVRLLESVNQGGTVFLTMEYLRGQSLREWMLQRTEPTPLGVLLDLGARIADILVEVHARGVVHRDLKPENIFLCPPREGDAGPQVKLLDFGIAKPPSRVPDAHAVTLLQTQDSTRMGTSPYMPPEQFESPAGVDARADVYSLGVILFELLAGRLPFLSEDEDEVLKAHAKEQPPALHLLASSLPPSLCAFVTSLLAKEPVRRPSTRRCQEMLRRTWTDAPERCPLPGLAPFSETQAELFLGREEETQEVLSRVEVLREGPRRCLLLTGADGVGKSSLLHAGVRPRLALTPGWRVVCWRPRDEPLRALARALASGPLPLGTGETAETVEQHLRSGPDALRAFASAHVPEGERLLLVVEPLEELLTLGGNESPAVEQLLNAALTAPESPVRLLSSLRSDFLPRLASRPLLAPLFAEDARVSLLPMESKPLTEALAGMAWITGLRLEPGLATQLVRESRTEANRLPLLGYALRGLWLLNTDAVLTHADYERLGGVSGALVQQAEALLDALSPQGRERARWMLLSLVRTGRSVPDTRRPRTRRDVLAAGGGDALAEQVLLQLSGRSTKEPGPAVGPRLLQWVEGQGAEEPRVELVHELLLSRVRVLAAWIEDARPWLERQADTETAAQVWVQAKCPVDGLPMGTLLAHYQQGADPVPGNTAGRGLASPEVVRFLTEARRLEQRRARARRWSALAAGLAVLVIVFFAAYAQRQRELAEDALSRGINAIDEFVGDWDWKLSRLAYTLPLREEMLTRFRQALEELTPSQRELPAVRRVFVKLLQRQADLAFHDASLEQAGRFLDEAEALLHAALAELPQDEGFLSRLALNYSKRGKVELARGHPDSACAHYAEALRMMKQNHEDAQTQAVSEAELAECEILAGQLEVAAASLQRASDLHEQDMTASAEPSAYKHALLAEVLGRQGDVALRAGETALALSFLDRALRHSETGRELASGGDQYSKWVLAQVRVKRAHFLKEQGQAVASRSGYQDAFEEAEEVRKGERESKRYALVLLDALAGLESLSPEQAPALRAKRCALARDFRARDEEDVRFKFKDCEDVHPSGGTP